jgi:hypothetical protein
MRMTGPIPAVGELADAARHPETPAGKTAVLLVTVTTGRPDPETAIEPACVVTE